MPHLPEKAFIRRDVARGEFKIAEPLTYAWRFLSRDDSLFAVRYFERASIGQDHRTTGARWVRSECDRLQQTSADLVDRFAMHDKTGFELGATPHSTMSAFRHFLCLERLSGSGTNLSCLEHPQSSDFIAIGLEP